MFLRLLNSFSIGTLWLGGKCSELLAVGIIINRISFDKIKCFFPMKSQNIFIHFFVLLHWSLADDGLLVMMNGL